jgi:hypothetical protein
MVPAISDANGPDPKPYAYDMEPEEEQAFRTKMLSLATDALLKYARVPAAASASSRKVGTKAAAKKSSASFEDVQLRIFDISLSNEPVLVLTATAHLPEAEKESPTPDYYVTLVARSDINGDMRKLMAMVTDPQHLDVSPRMQLIDAVDADGDGRAELLFRQISDAGAAYVIYRVHPDQLWTLYEGTPE